MTSDTLYTVAADLVLTLHVGIVAFNIVGLLVVLLGGALGWRWVRNGWFRLAHLLCIAVIVGQAWLGIICPLTTLEQWLRAQAGEVVYAGSFIAHWLDELLYYDAPWWVFTAAYTVFGALVVLSWLWVRPAPLRAPSAGAAPD